MKKNGWDGKDVGDDGNPKLQWSFAGALLYSVTVITTIGKFRPLPLRRRRSSQTVPSLFAPGPIRSEERIGQ